MKELTDRCIPQGKLKCVLISGMERYKFFGDMAHDVLCDDR